MANKYWQQRQRDSIYNHILGTAEKQLANEYKRCFEATYGKISALYDEINIAKKNGTLLISDLYKFNRYYELMNALNSNLNKLGQKEIQIYGDSLKRMYLTNSQLIIDELGYYNGSGVYANENQIKTAINSIWCKDGKHWSSRIWSNKQALQEKIKDGLVDCIARGVSKDELVNQLRKDMNVGYYEAERIARTELTYIQNQSTYDKYKEAGIEKYEFLAELDSRTSEICRKTNGKVFRMDEAQVGLNYPPLHPNCRSTVLAVLN